MVDIYHVLYSQLYPSFLASPALMVCKQLSLINLRSLTIQYFMYFILLHLYLKFESFNNLMSKCWEMKHNIFLYTQLFHENVLKSCVLSPYCNTIFSYFEHVSEISNFI